MRSQGRKICWEQLEEERRDSDRLMSRLRRRGSFGELGPGDLEMLLLLLENKDDRRIRTAAGQYLVQHIPSFPAKGPVSNVLRCFYYLQSQMLSQHCGSSL